MFYHKENCFKKRFFINIQISCKDINTSTEKRQNRLNEMVAVQNEMKEIYYGNKDILKDVFISDESIRSVFPHFPKACLLDADRFRPTIKNDISLLEALEFIAFDVEPTDEYGKKVRKFRPIYNTDPFSEEGKKQLTELQIAAEILEALFERGLNFREDNETQYNEHVGFAPKVSITEEETKAVLTDKSNGKSYDDIKVNYEDLKKAFVASCEPRPNTYRLDIIDHALYIFKNDQKHKVQDFKIQKRGTLVPQSEIVLKYIINHPNQDVSLKQVENSEKINVKQSLNFDNMFQYFTKPTAHNLCLKKAILEHFFEQFEASCVRYKGVIFDFPDYLLD